MAPVGTEYGQIKPQNLSTTRMPMMMPGSEASPIRSLKFRGIETRACGGAGADAIATG